MNMRILVTGADGFIGRALVARLPPGDDVFLHCGFAESVSSFQEAGFSNVMYGDLSVSRGSELLPDTNVDVVVHLAGLPGGTDDALKSSNVAVTEGVVRWVERHSVERVVFASTAAIYGDTCEVPATEEVKPVPQTAYAKSKLDSELMLQHLCCGGPALINMRMPHAYGPGKHVGVLAAILARMRADGVVCLNGDGNEKRDFIFIDDLVEAFVLAMDSNASNGVNAYNIGSGVSLSLREACAIIGEAVGVVPDVRLTGEPAGQPHCIQLNVEKAARELGWVAKTDLSEGVRRMLGEVECGE